MQTVRKPRCAETAYASVAKYVYDHKLTDKTEISVETGAGIKYLTLYVEENKVSQVRVDMVSLF